MLWRRELRELRAAIDLNRETTERLFAEMHEFKREERLRANKVLEPLIASHHELIEEVRAQRGALLALIDEMRGGHPGGAAA